MILQQNLVLVIVSTHLKVMDGAVEDVMRMLASDSYHRFMQTPKFQKLVNANQELSKLEIDE